VIAFFEKTWFLWWTLAITFILRWFHLFSSDTEEAIDRPASGKKEAAAIASGQLPSESANRYLFETESRTGKHGADCSMAIAVTPFDQLRRFL